jgi:Holliday junction resolvase
VSAANKRRGTQRELAVRDWFRDRDWLAFRAPASLGVADVVAMKVGERSRLVEVKSTHRGPYHGFLPADRARLKLAAELAGADALLAWWPPRGELVFIPSDAWPA